MECKHERIKSENCVISCVLCGKILPIDYLVGKDRIAQQKAAEPPAEGQETVAESAPKKRTTRKTK